MGTELDELNDLMTYLDIHEDLSGLEQAGFMFERKQDHPQKWQGKWDYIGSNSPMSGTYRVPTEGGLISHHTPGAETPTHPKGHYGIDIGAQKGQSVYAIGPGIVRKVYSESDNPLGGNAVITSHDNGKITSYYAHMNTVNVHVGDKVDSNTIIGTVGNTGGIEHGKKRGLSPHLHWQVKINGNDINPLAIEGKPINIEAAVKYVLKKLS